MTIRELFFGCWMRHDEVIWADGVLRCQDCGMVREVLQQPVIIGPAHQPAEVRGVPVTRVTRWQLRKVS